MLWIALALAAAPLPAQPSPASLPPIFSRVSEEAEIFQQNMPKALTREVLLQRAQMPPSRFQPRAGADVPPAAPRLRTREVVSEYSVAALKDSESGDLVEFRQVISVDGNAVQSPEKARHALSLGMKSADDRLRKRMLEEFARNGLVDIATDYGLILLAFTRRGLENMHVELAGQSQIGAESALVFRWSQITPAGGELEFHGREAAHRPLTGTLWVRKSDGLPLRIQAWTEHEERKHTIRDEASVEYVQNAHGFLAPASVVHRHILDGQLITENLYRYDPFKLFSSDAEIKFTEVPDPEPPAVKKK
jgi:hypothetical protein